MEEEWEEREGWLASWRCVVVRVSWTGERPGWGCRVPPAASALPLRLCLPYRLVVGVGMSPAGSLEVVELLVVRRKGVERDEVASCEEALGRRLLSVGADGDWEVERRDGNYGRGG